MLDIIIKNGIVITMAGGRAGIVPEGSVGIKDNIIKCIGDSVQIAKDYKAKEVIDAKGKFILPGFINVHAHTAGGIGKGILSGLRYYLEHGLAGYNGTITKAASIASTKMHVLDALKHGTTTFCDNNKGMSDVVFVLDEMGVRGRVSEMIREMPWDYGSKLDEIYTFDRKYAEEGIKGMYTLLDTYGTDVNDRISTMVSFQALDYNSEDLVKELIGVARDKKAMIHTHLAQSMFEVKQCEARYGMRPVAILDKLGILNSNTLAAHMVYNTPEENKIAARSGLNMAFCPNAFTRAGGISPAAQYVSENGIVGIGSDECAYNCGNPFVDMRSGLIRGNIDAKLAQVEALRMLKVLKMATIDAAKAIGLGDQVGSLEVGKKADVVIFNPNVINMMPVLLNPLSNIVPTLVWSATGEEVETVICNGKIIVRDKVVLTADEEGIKAEVQKAAEKAALGAYEFYSNMEESEVLNLQKDYH